MQRSLNERLAHFFGLAPQLVGLLFGMRLLVDTGFRMLYPFIPQFAEGLRLGVTGFSWLLFIRSWVGLTGPIFGLLADLYGRRRIMAGALLAQGMGLIGVSLLTGWASIAPMLLFGLGATALIPAQQAYLSDLVPYARRGRALASVDISFSTAGIIALPLVGWLIETWSWRSPFMLLGGLSLLAAFIALQRLPQVEPRSEITAKPQSIKILLGQPNVLASILVGTLLFTAYSFITTLWGIWLSRDFQLDAIDLGLVATVIGLAELSGAVASGLLIDRIGKQRGSFLGVLCASLLVSALAFSQESLLAVRILLAALGFTFEFSIVSLFVLFSEQVPDARATLLSLVAVGISIGMGAAAPLAVALWEWQGLGVVCAAAAGALLGTAVLVRHGLHETGSVSLPGPLED